MRRDYDPAGRVFLEQYETGTGIVVSHSFEYWPDGSLKRRWALDGTATGNYVYDAAGKLDTVDNAVTTSASEPDLYVNGTAYNARGRTRVIAYGNGTSSTYTYNDAMGWLTGVQTRQTGAAAGLDLSYGRKLNGMIEKITALKPDGSADPGNSWDYAYDELNRLTEAKNATAPLNFGPSFAGRRYRYDDVDNLTYNSGLCASNPNLVYPAQGVGAAAAGAPSNHPHAPSSICGVPVTYDANGNTLSYDPDGTAGVIQPRAFLYPVEVAVGILQPLQASIDAAVPSHQLTFLVTARGAPFAKESFGTWFGKACDAAGVPGSAHGLRKIAAVRCAENGATEAELNAMFGWADGSNESATYVRKANREKLARQASAKLLTLEKSRTISPNRNKTKENIYDWWWAQSSANPSQRRVPACSEFLGIPAAPSLVLCKFHLPV